MKEKRDCKIVQDLLPNYIEKLTNEETNIFIEEHLKECGECQKVFGDMKKELNVDSKKRDEREVKYIKKYSKKLKILKAILLTILTIYIIVVCKRTIIMTSLSYKAVENLKNDNYYAKLCSYQGKSLIITECYNNGEDYLSIITNFTDGNEISKMTHYKKGNEELHLIEFNGEKHILENSVSGKVVPVTYIGDEIIVNFMNSFITGVEHTYCNGKECYVIRGKSYERYIDKETGLAIRDIERSNRNITRDIDIVVDYEYIYNVVDDSDIIKPDIMDAISIN